MKKSYYLAFGCLTLIMLAGCGQKTMMQVSFGNYSLQRNTNGKIYTAIAVQPGSRIHYQAQEATTGTANSFIISQMELPAGASLADVVSLNTDQLSKKLLNYKGSKSLQSKGTCRGIHLTGYATNFSYDLDPKQTFYVYQYYFIQDNLLYLISFQADNIKDVTATSKSISSIVCK